MVEAEDVITTTGAETMVVVDGIGLADIVEITVVIIVVVIVTTMAAIIITPVTTMVPKPTITVLVDKETGPPLLTLGPLVPIKLITVSFQINSVQSAPKRFNKF